MAKEFTLFPKLPRELQFAVWKECTLQHPPQIFEIRDYDLSNSYRSGSLVGGFRFTLDNLSFSDMIIHSPKISYAILQVDKTSRKELSKVFRKIDLFNATIRFRMDVDTIYFPSTLGTFTFGSSSLGGQMRDPLFGEIQNLALGIPMFMNLHRGAVHDRDPVWLAGRGDRGDGEFTWGLPGLEPFKKLKSFTLVFLHGNITNEDPNYSGHGALEFGAVQTHHDYSLDELELGLWSGNLSPTGQDPSNEFVLTYISAHMGTIWNHLQTQEPDRTLPVLECKRLLRDGLIQMQEGEVLDDIGYDTFDYVLAHNLPQVMQVALETGQAERDRLIIQDLLEGDGFGEQTLEEDGDEQ